MHRFLDQRRSSARGFTLLELMIVVFILTLLMAAAIPIIRPAFANSELREASRSFTTMLAVAKSRAMETRRPYGVVLVPGQGMDGGAYTLFYAYVPPPYSGDTTDAHITFNSATTGTVSGGSAFGQFVGIGDQIRFNFQGPRYEITGLSPLTFAPPAGVTPPNPQPGTKAQFQVFRKPIRAAGTPVQLPGNSVIDLRGSGIGSGQFSAGERIAIMFSPSGQLDAIYVGVDRQAVNSDSVFFLIGSAGKLVVDAADQNDPETSNLAALENIWVGINGRTGKITSAENAVGTNPQQRRQYAQSGQSMRG